MTNGVPGPKKQDQNQMRIGIIKKLKSPRKNLLICSRPSERSEPKPNLALTAGRKKLRPLKSPLGE
jgi:hypothetical protein